MSSSIPNIAVNFGPVQGRKRALTRTLLGSQYEETVTSILDPPEPLQNLSDYTIERVREGLRYADITLRNPQRKISPGGAIALGLYKDTCIGLLDLLDVEEGEIFETTEEERKELEDSHRAFMREAEKGIQLTAFMKATKTNSAQELQDEILNLRRVAFYGRYGDYFAEVCNNLKVAAEKGKLAGWQQLSNTYWTAIAGEVKLEEPVYMRFKKGERGLHEQMPTTYSIQAAAYLIGLNPDDTLAVVRQYGLRNDLLHANLLPLIKGGFFWKLGERLCHDRTDIPLLVPAADRFDGRILETLLDSMIDLWFERNDLDVANFEMWIPTPALRSKHKELHASSAESEARINKEIAKDITKAFKQNLRKSQREDEMIALFETINGQKLPPKRVASSQLDEEREKLRQRKKKWAAIESITRSAKSLYDAYVLSGDGEIGAPREIVEDKDL